MLQRSAARVAGVIWLAGLLSCKESTEPVVPASVEAVWIAPAAPVAGVAIDPRPSVKVTSSDGKPVPGVVVTFTVTSGGGSITGNTQTTDANGLAMVGSWTLGATVGANVLNATVPSLSPVQITVNSVAGPAAAIATMAGDNQSATVGTSVATPPSVKITDANGNAVSGVQVTFAVASGGGSITDSTAMTNSSGVATVGSWTLGPSDGTNTLTATVAGLSGSLVTFTATATTAASFVVSSVSPSVWVAGATATISGQGFSTTAAQNIVTIDNVAATVSAATPSQLTITVPTTLPCEPTHDGTVAVSVGGSSVTKTHPVQTAKQRTLAIGQSLIVSDPAELRCNELSSTSGLYYVNVYNTNTTYSPSGAAFQLRGASASGVAAADILAAASATPSRALNSPRRGRAEDLTGPEGPAEDRLGEALHLKILEENTRILNERGRGLYAELASRARRRSGSVMAAVQAGDAMTLRIPNFGASNFCKNYFEITGRVVYVGTKSIIVEDNANPMAGTIDTTYTSLGVEFDQTMFGILESNFGNPLAMDAVTDNNGRVIMVFSKVVNDSMSTLAGFVVSCDLFPRNASGNAQSNFGEYFYARVPTVPGTVNDTGSPPRWRWTIRSTIIHEAKHITSFAERVSRNASVFEATWLEESTARISEELYERATYGFAQKSNIGYGSAADPKGPYCDVRVRFEGPCFGKPRGIYGIFQDLTLRWFPEPATHSPLGRISSSDFTFYNTGWSLVRWSIDQSSLAEGAFLKGLTQETTRNGVANLETRAGRTFADMLPEWSLAMALDDYPGFAPALSRLQMPSWNLRSVFAGMNTDFPSSYPQAWPLVASQRTFGNFTVDSQVYPGTASFLELSGSQTAKQLIELKAQGSSAGAPAELRLAIVRVQ